jgi:hypothetical protein
MAQKEIDLGAIATQHGWLSARTSRQGALQRYNFRRDETSAPDLRLQAAYRRCNNFSEHLLGEAATLHATWTARSLSESDGLPR